MSDNKELIARLRTFAYRSDFEYLPYTVKEDCKRAADALEAAQAEIARLGELLRVTVNGNTELFETLQSAKADIAALKIANMETQAESDEYFLSRNILQADHDKMAAELAALRAQEPIDYQYLFSNALYGNVWRDSPSEWNGNKPKASRAIYAAPVPARELSDEEIEAIAIATQSAEPGRDGYILPFQFARAIIAATKGKP